MIKMMVKNTTDAVEASKRIFIDTFVKHDGLNKAFHDFVNAQSDYTRKAIDTMFKATDDVGKIIYEKFTVKTSDTVSEKTEKKGK